MRMNDMYFMKTTFKEKEARKKVPHKSGGGRKYSEVARGCPPPQKKKIFGEG